MLLRSVDFLRSENREWIAGTSHDQHEIALLVDLVDKLSLPHTRTTNLLKQERV